MPEAEQKEEQPAEQAQNGYKRTLYALKRSNLFMLEDSLVKQDKDGDPIAQYKLSNIQSVSADTQFSYIGFSILLVGMGLVALGYFVIEPSNWAWLTYILGGLIAIFGAITIKEDILVVEAGGKRFTYIVQEDNEELAGFAYSADEYAKEKQKRT